MVIVIVQVSQPVPFQDKPSAAYGPFSGVVDPKLQTLWKRCVELHAVNNFAIYTLNPGPE